LGNQGSELRGAGGIESNSIQTQPYCVGSLASISIDSAATIPVWRASDPDRPLPCGGQVVDNEIRVEPLEGDLGKGVVCLMPTLPRLFKPVCLLLIVPFTNTLADDRGGSGSSSGSSGSMPRANIPAAVGGGGWSYYPFPYYQTVGPDGRPVTLLPPMLVPTVVVPVETARPPAPVGQFGLAGPLPRGGLPRVRPVQKATKKKVDPARAEQLTTFGDRLFRAGNTRKAEERYEQAVRANPYSAGPRIRLAQLELIRGHYREAANHIRDAQAAQPGWLTEAIDIQSIYSEPADFAKPIARLESHLQAEPADRDAWLVLGAQWFLSGRTQKAADVFLRLTDREPDDTLDAFLQASRATAPAVLR